ncbi:MAG: hypothetical protein NTW87_32690, partial [Planctomycetota bacterium]|nr:hypothetical protein [Planctomycetota bacterium]
DGQSGDGAAGDGVFGARLEKVPLDVLAKARAGDYRGPALPGQVTLKVQARLGAASETGFALLTVLQPAANMKLWDGESHDALVTRGEGGVGIAVCQEHPFSGDTHLRVHVSGPGLAALGWHRHGVWPGSDDMRFHKLFTFCIRSNTPGPSELTLRLRDDGATYGFENARSSNQLSLSRYLPQLTTRYQRVAIPMADFVWGSAVGPERIRELEFIAPAAETRLYDIDDVGLAAKPGPILSDCEAALAPDGSSVRVSVRATSTAGALKSAKASCEGKEFELYDDGRHGDGESGDGCYANIIPLAQVGTGTRTFHFVATDAEGTTDDTAAAFLPRRPPGQIARARSGVKIDGDLAEFADATPFAVGDDKLGLRARLLYEKNCLYVGVEVKDAAYNPQPPKKGQRKPPPEKLAESGSAELVITSPTAATCLARTSAADDDHRFVFVMDEQQAFALRGNQRLPAAGKKTEGGYLIEAQIPFDLLRSRRGQCDFERGKHTRIEWRLIGADGRKLVWNAADAEASANPENWGLARFTDEAGTPKLRYTRTDGKVLTLVSSKRLKADAAQRASSYDIPGLRVENVTLENDGRTVRITASAPLKIGDALKVRFNGLQSEDGFPTEPELAFSPLPGRPLNGELLQEFLIGEVRRDVDMQSVTKAHIDETTKPVRGPQWGLATAEGGIFNLNQLAGGFNNALVHAHAYLHADKERAVQVWVGSDDGVRVVVNGAPVFTVPVSRGCIPDQDKIKDVKLKAGWNSLLLAVWNGSGEWSLCARIMDENGNPPQGVSYQADSPFAAPPAGVTAPPPSDETFSAASTADVTVEKTDFMGWKGACRISNKACELVVVPQISRVLHFSPKGGQNLLWINGALAGKTVPSDDRQWHNFGGDKVWPTAQTLWQKYTGRAGWPPPYPFDCGVGTVEPIPSGVRLTTPKDPQFGAVCVREFVMDAQRPLVQVRQRYEKSDGAPAEMTLWTITQVRKPEFALLPLGKEDQGKQYRKLQSLIEPLFASHKTVLSLRNDEAQGQ